MDYYRPLTPDFRNQINAGIESLIAELNTCQPNVLVLQQKESLRALEYLIGKLPDGYPMPMKNQKGG